jgi:hypothetical protein
MGRLVVTTFLDGKIPREATESVWAQTFPTDIFSSTTDRPIRAPGSRGSTP